MFFSLILWKIEVMTFWKCFGKTEYKIFWILAQDNPRFLIFLMTDSRLFIAENKYLIVLDCFVKIGKFLCFMWMSNISVEYSSVIGSF